jgi:lipopolysaccharide assembly protein A
MRTIYLIIIILFAAVTIIFGLQNLDTLTVSFLRFSLSAPVAVVVFIVYVVGAVTGGSLFALLRRSYAASRGP